MGGVNGYWGGDNSQGDSVYNLPVSYIVGDSTKNRRRTPSCVCFVTTVAGLITMQIKQAISNLILDDFEITRLVTRRHRTPCTQLQTIVFLLTLVFF